MGIVIEVPCEGHDHRIEFRGDGTIHMLDHDERVVRGFVAFGAKPPACLEAINEAEEDPVEFLLDKIEVDEKARTLLACDFAEHVLPIWYEYHPDDHRPKKAIEATRKYVAGKIKKSTLDKARASAAEASRAAAWAWAAASSAAASSAAASSAGWAAWTASTASSASASAAWYAERAASSAVFVHAEAHGDDPEETSAVERKWQAARMVQVLEAISRGEDPWAS